LSAHFLYEIPYVERIDLIGKPTAALLRWNDARPDERDKPGAYWGFEHQCQSWLDPNEPDGHFMKVVAPRLTNHTITRNERGQITVRASILCPDCGLHGFVTNDRWEAA
jgi:hypothetical protein